MTAPQPQPGKTNSIPVAWIVALVLAIILAIIAGVFLGTHGDGDSDVGTVPPVDDNDGGDDSDDAGGADDGDVDGDDDDDPIAPEHGGDDDDDPPAPATAGAVIVDGWVLGWYDGGRWNDGSVTAGDDLAAPIAVGDTYDFIDADGDVVTRSITELAVGCEFEENHFTVGATGHGLVGVASGIDTQPREVASIAPAAAHEEDVRDWLEEQGISDPEVSIDRVLRVDLDDDGDDEVLIEASKVENPDALLGEPEGSYTVILLRSLDEDDQVVTQAIAGLAVDAANAESESFPGFIEVFDLLAVADVDGDGTFEIAIGARYYEGASAALHAFDGTMTTEVSVAGCGA